MHILSDFSVSVRLFTDLFHYLDKNVSCLEDKRGIEDFTYQLKGKEPSIPLGTKRSSCQFYLLVID